MALSVTTAPAPGSIVPCKTPVNIELLSTGYITNAGEYASIELKLTGLTPENQDFILSFLDNDLLFTFKDSPDDSGLQIQSGAAYDFVDDWVIESVIRDLMNNYLIATNYKLSLIASSSSECTIRLTAINKGAAYNISYSNAATYVASQNIVAGVDVEYSTNYRGILDVWVEPVFGSGNFILASSKESIPDNSNKCSFNINGVLKEFCSVHLPPFTGSVIAPVDAPLKRFYLKYAEQSGVTRALTAYKSYPAYTTSQPVLSALLAGLPYKSRLATNFTTEYCTATTIKWLTSMPANVEIRKSQHIHLSAYCNNANTARVWVKLFYTDTTSSSDIQVGTLAGSNLGKILSVRAGYNQLNIDGIKASGKTVSKYKIWLDYSSGTGGTEMFTFKMDLRTHRVERYFHFANSLGGIDSMFFYGERDESVSVTSQQINVHEDTSTYLSTGVYLGDVRQANHEQQNRYEISTGFKNRQFLEWFKQLLNSGQILEQLTDKYVAVYIPKAAMKIDSDLQEQYALSINYEEAWKEVAP